MRERLDPSEYGGAPLLGVNGVAIIAHGSSNPRAIKHAIRAAADEALVRQVNAEIVEMLRKIPVATGPTPRPAGKGIRGNLLPDARAAPSASPGRGGCGEESEHRRFELS